MKISNPTLFVEINNLNFIFSVGIYDEQENLRIDYNSNVALKG